MRWFLAGSMALSALPLLANDPPAKLAPEQVEFFEAKVRPLLAEKCYSCHGAKKQNAGLRLDTSSGAKAGADDGPVIVAGKPENSRLIASVKRQGEHPMPPKEKLSPDAVAILTEWVKQGAAYPADRAQSAADPRKHWAFQPIKNPAVPAAANARTEVDRFIAAKLSDHGMSMAKPADRRTLMRRAYFDLIGLPPTAEELDAFEKDPSPQAFEKVVDRLLASPQYGERWGRYWLDVARYADTKGYVFQEERAFPFAYTYRDYVVRSFNEDKPFDRFIVEQLAADLLPLGKDKRPLAAMGYLTLGRRFLNNTPDIIDDRIDVVCRGLMGLTLSCARCHDHKFDPIPTKDYYSLYGVFASSVEPKELPLIGEVQRTPEVEAFEKEVAKREADYTAAAEKKHAAAVAKLRTAASIAEYLRAVLDSRGLMGRELNGFARERDLSRFVLEKWQAYLAAETKKHSPIFSPLIALHAAVGPEFDARAAAIVAKLGTDPAKPVHPRVLKALKEAKLKSFRVAAEAVAQAIIDGHKDDAKFKAILGPNGPVDIALADTAKILNRLDRDQLTALRKKIDAFKATNPAAPPRAHVLNDAARPTQPVVFLRGNPNSRGPSVPRQFPAVLAGPERKPFAHGSGRLELARAIASPDNPLTARVFVNRVWIGHFGQGLVRTPSDFGLRSDPPTHPELLDWLASRFIRDGWSVKKLHRLIMLSAAYQQASNPEPGMGNAESKPENARSAKLFGISIPHAPDVENRWLGHQNRRRLDFEAMRDSLLFTAGRLSPAMGGRSVDILRAPFSTRRTIYGTIDRSNFPGTFRSFDVASPDQHSPQRFQTTVPQQALFLLNSPFVVEQAKALANRSEVKSAKTAEDRIVKLYRAALGRNPTHDELDLARTFLGDGKAAGDFGPWEQLAQVLLMSNEFLFVD